MKKLLIAACILSLSACTSSNIEVQEQETQEIPTLKGNITAEEAHAHFTAICNGYAKAGAENGFDTEVNIFSKCMENIQIRIHSLFQ